MKDWVGKLNDTVWVGLALGFAVPLLSGAIMVLIMSKVAALNGADLLLIGCVALNAWLMNYCFRQDKENIGRGILIVTFLWALAFLFYKIL